MTMTINAHTKIASLIKHHPDALEAIVSISPKFTRLRNPILRKVIAGRTSISMASKMGGCSVKDFFDKLQPLGFDIDLSTGSYNIVVEKPVPAFLTSVTKEQIVELDVRPTISKGEDPLNLIIQKVKALEKGYVLNIINSFEPTPLIHLLGRQGFESYSKNEDEDLWHTYFYKNAAASFEQADSINADAEGWEETWKRFEGRMETIDVRDLAMPLPMHTILDALNTMPENKTLFVLHKRIPLFLLQELDELGFSYRIKEISDTQVQLLIYKD
jgi:uncharacterized protein (DUF2249 family)